MAATSEPTLPPAGTPDAGKRTAAIERIDEILELTYRSASLGNFSDPLDEVIYIILSKQTREAVYQRVFSTIKERWASWEDLLQSPEGELEAVVRPAGFGPSRASQIRAVLQAVATACAARGITGAVTLDWLRQLSDRQALTFLDSLPGVGPKTARCVAHYSLGRRVFAVDTHVQRIFGRLGIIPPPAGKVDHSPYEDIVPSRIRQRLHINLVHHGRSVCRTTNPVCGNCSLISFCGEGRTRSTSGAKPVAVELFSGAGGMGSGLIEAGYHIAVAVEWNREAAQTYRVNHPGTAVIEADVRTVGAESIARLMPAETSIQLLAAGPPCQGYSAAGNRNADDDKNALFVHVARLARELQPRFVLVENVPGMRRVGGASFVGTVLSELKAAGYNTEDHILRACDYGVPQLRHRILFLGQRADLGQAPTAPARTHCARCACEDACGQHPGSQCNLPAVPTVLDALAGLPELPHSTDAEFAWIDGTLLINGSTMRHSERVVEKIREITPGSGPISYRRLSVELAHTIIAGHRALPVHPSLDRTLSVREAARIQGFKDGHVFAGPRWLQPLQVANAVPPPLARAIGEHLIKLASKSDMQQR